MKKYLALLAVLGLAACSVPSEPEQNASPVAETYFFPQANGLRYTYSHDDLITSDTSTYQVVVNGAYNQFSRLEKVESDTMVDNNALYYFMTSTNNREGLLQCILAKQSATGENIIALQGTLNVGSTWKANSDGSVIATVENHYDFYYLVGRERKYDDVIVVKYVDSREPDGTYMLRYFANGYGLIHEKRIMSNDSDATTEVSNLRLLDRKTLGGEIIPRLPDHWWNAHGRYGIAPRLLTEEDD